MLNLRDHVLNARNQLFGRPVRQEGNTGSVKAHSRAALRAIRRDRQSLTHSLVERVDATIRQRLENRRDLNEPIKITAACTYGMDPSNYVALIRRDLPRRDAWTMINHEMDTEFYAALEKDVRKSLEGKLSDLELRGMRVEKFCQTPPAHREFFISVFLDIGPKGGGEFTKDAFDAAPAQKNRYC